MRLWLFFKRQTDKAWVENFSLPAPKQKLLLVESRRPETGLILPTKIFKLLKFLLNSK